MRIAPLLAALALVTLLVGCGDGADEPSAAGTAGGEDVAANQNAPPPEPYAAAPPTATHPRSAGETSHEHPLRACGPVDSYRQVAQHRCADGSMPLGGDPSAGQQARAGNVGPNSSGHVIDLYEVPCPEGTVQIYVDMYGCPEMQQLIGP